LRKLTVKVGDQPRDIEKQIRDMIVRSRSLYRR